MFHNISVTDKNGNRLTVKKESIKEYGVKEFGGHMSAYIIIDDEEIELQTQPIDLFAKMKPAKIDISKIFQ